MLSEKAFSSELLIEFWNVLLYMEIFPFVDYSFIICNVMVMFFFDDFVPEFHLLVGMNKCGVLIRGGLL